MFYFYIYRNLRDIKNPDLSKFQCFVVLKKFCFSFFVKIYYI